MKRTKTEEQIAVILEELRARRTEGIRAVMEKVASRGETADPFMCTLVYDMELSPKITNEEQLRRIGYEFEVSQDIPDDLIAGELRQLVGALARIHVFVTGSNHMTDREVYEMLTEKTMLEIVHDIPACRDMAEFLDLSAGEEREPICKRDETLPRPEVRNA